MVINADKSSDHTVTVTSNNGALLSSAVTHQGADLISKTVSIDSNGDGFADVTETVAVDAVTSIRTDTSSTLAPSGTLINRIIAITSADGLSLTTNMDIDGIGEAKNDNRALLKWRKAK